MKESALLFVLDGNLPLQSALLKQFAAAGKTVEAGDCVLRHFPDGESYVRINSDCKDRDAMVVCSLHRPDRFILPLLFCADTLRERGARSVGLIAPYLAYMRQDKAFHEGEAVSSRLFAPLLSQHFDWLVTVDPHLHRYKDLAEIYTVPHRVIHAAPLLANWIQKNIERPLLVGPDSESEQWVAAVAQQGNFPFVVLEKIRRGDREVEVSVPDVARWRHHTPVLLDDIISTGHTLLETITHVQRAGLPPPVCLAVHGLFAEEADKKLLASNVKQIVTSNSVPHSTNRIDLSPPLVQAVLELYNQI